MAPVKAGYWFNGCGVSLEKLRTAYFTHLYFGFAGIDFKKNEIKISKVDEYDISVFTEKVQDRNPSVKTLLSIGGGTAMAKWLAEIAKSDDARKSFIQSSIEVARQHNFHGLDLHWKYPRTQEEMNYFSLLLKEWRSEIGKKATGGDPLLLTTATSFQPKSQDSEYDADVLKQLDWINVIAYDFPPASSGDLTEPYATLDDANKEYTVVKSLNAWKKKNMPAEKIVLGLPFHGYKKLLETNANGVSAPADGWAKGGDIRKDGLINYNDVRDFMSCNGIEKSTYDSANDTEYCTAGATRISYNDKDSITKRVKRAKTEGLNGYFVSNVGADSEWTLCEAASKAWEESVVALGPEAPLADK